MGNEAMTPRETLEHLLAGEHLSREQAASLLRRVLDGEVNPETLAAMLATMRFRGETPTELMGFLDVLDERANRLPFEGGRLIDTCGTGGDGLGTFNVSTAAAVVIASAGVPVAKHGNRSVSSKSGSSDVLEAAGVPLTGEIPRLADTLNELGLVFLFAPFHHPALKEVAGVRKAMRVMTVFNQLGPLANPAPLTHQYVGVSQPVLLKRYGTILAERGIEAGVVHGRSGADEALPGGTFRWTPVREGRLGEEQVIDPSALGVGTYPLEAFRGGDAKENASLLWQILQGEGPAPLEDAVVLNAGLGLWVADEVGSAREGVQLARELVRAAEPARLLRAYAARISA